MTPPTLLLYVEWILWIWSKENQSYSRAVTVHILRSAMQHQSENDGRSSVGSSCSNKSMRDLKNLSSDAENSDFYLNESDEEVNKHDFEDESGCKSFLKSAMLPFLRY